jgi:ribosome biogenesis protein SLX9
MDARMYVLIYACGGGATGLEASRAPYSKSHARRLKRKEKEELVGGRLGTLQAALPSIAPMMPAASAGVRSAGKLDAPAATTTATAASSAKIIVGGSKPTDVPDPDVAPQQPQTRPGQIGEGKGTPLTTSQRRRALYDIICLSSVIVHLQLM